MCYFCVFITLYSNSCQISQKFVSLSLSLYLSLAQVNLGTQLAWILHRLNGLHNGGTECLDYIGALAAYCSLR